MLTTTARAGTRSARYWGNDPDAACRYANVADRTEYADISWPDKHECSDGYFFVAPVGRFRANAWGLHDMLGNLWEWTCSSYDQAYNGEEGQCGHKNDSNFVIRSGSWALNPYGVRSASRGGNHPVDRLFDLGFRPAKSP